MTAGEDLLKSRGDAAAPMPLAGVLEESVMEEDERGHEAGVMAAGDEGWEMGIEKKP